MLPVGSGSELRAAPAASLRSLRTLGLGTEHSESENLRKLLSVIRVTVKT